MDSFLTTTPEHLIPASLRVASRRIRRAEQLRSRQRDEADGTELAPRRPLPSLLELCQRTVQFELHSWQTDYLIPTLERCRHEKGLRLLIHGPAQFGKSIITAQRLPAYLIGCDPFHRVALMTFSQGKSEMFGTTIKDIMHGPVYRELFDEPLSQIPNYVSSASFSTFGRRALLDAQPSFSALGLDTGLPGIGPDTLIIDDPYAGVQQAESPAINLKVQTVIDHNVMSRMSATSNMIVMFHRWHDEDIAAYIKRNYPEFELLRFPALGDGNKDGNDPTGREIDEPLSPIRSFEWLDGLRERDPHFFAGHFQGLPQSQTGGYILREWLEIGQCPPIRRWVRYWDLAVGIKKKSDFTVGLLAGVDSSQNLWIRDVVRFKGEWPDVANLICETTEEDLERYANPGQTYDVGLDSRMLQQAFAQELFRRPVFIAPSEEPWGTKESSRKRRARLHKDTSKGDKKERSAGWRLRARNGGMRLHRNPLWNEAYIDECVKCTFIDGIGHDDQIDATSGCYMMLWDRPGGETKNNGNKINPYSPDIEDRVFRRNDLPW